MLRRRLFRFRPPILYSCGHYEYSISGVRPLSRKEGSSRTDSEESQAEGKSRLRFKNAIENLHLEEKLHNQRENVSTKFHDLEDRAKVSKDRLIIKSREQSDRVKEAGKEKISHFKEESKEKIHHIKEELRDKSIEQKEKIREISHEKVEKVKERGREVRAKTRERAIRENWYTVPNAISMGRLVIAPVTGYCIIHGHFHVALGLNVVSLISDWADGQIARTWPSQQSALGTALDPLADKITMLIVYSTFYMSGGIPGWLFFPIIGRDIALVITSAVIRYKTLPKPRTFARYVDFGLVTVKVYPTWISKFILPTWLLTQNVGYLPAYEFFTIPLCGLTLLTTTISTLEYFVLRRDIIT